MKNEHFPSEKPNSPPEEPDFTPEERALIERMVSGRRVVDTTSAERQIIARRHWQRGHLGVTAADHLAFGGTPDQELADNPGSTLGQILSMEKILEKLKELVDFLENARKEYKGKGPNHPDYSWHRDDIIHAKQELIGSVNYLKLIGKLPKEFETFEIIDSIDDPKI